MIVRLFQKGDRVKPSPRGIAQIHLKPEIRGTVWSRPNQQTKITVMKDGTRTAAVYASVFWQHADDVPVVE